GDAGPAFVRGDANRDERLDLGDALSILNYLFAPDSVFVPGSPPLPCLDAADINDSGGLDLADAVYDLTFLFASGAPPKAPFPSCGPDATPDSLDCGSPGPCAPGGV
ncbi:MAG: hypothetical protein JXP34_22100, partial [Planctomycetes bacterium]|nr:hypothetical protein [Planctomycetota bacterium]